MIEHRRDRVAALFVELARVVDLSDLALDEAGRDVRHGHAVVRELGAERFGERAHRELAHRVGARPGQRQEARHAPEEPDAPARALQRPDGRLHRAQDAEDVRLELPSIIVDRELLDGPHEADSRVRDDDVEVAERRERLANGALDGGVVRDVACDRARIFQLARELLQAIFAPSEEATCAPRLSYSRARAAPIPEEAPVIKTESVMDVRF